MDEFIFLKNFKNIKSFLNDKRFKRCNLIHLNRVFHTDNDQIYYKNRSLFQRFPKYKTKITSVKPIVRGHLNNINIKSQHAINYKYKACVKVNMQLIINIKLVMDLDIILIKHPKKQILNIIIWIIFFSNQLKNI